MSHASLNGRSKKRRVLRLTGRGREVVELGVISEVPLTIFFNGYEVVTLLTTGDHLGHLAVGFLSSEGLLRSREEINSLEVDEGQSYVKVTTHPYLTTAEQFEFLERFLSKKTITSGCGRGWSYSPLFDQLQPLNPPLSLSISREDVLSLMAQLQSRSHLYRETRGVHSAALATTKEILIFREDVGRHNAIDKIYGKAFLEGLPLSDKVLLTSGRVSSEIMAKVARMGVAIIISRSAPTDLALALAEKVKATVIGYVRGREMRVYLGEERVRWAT